MNKTVTVNISGAIFNIEEQAFEKLNRYLNAVKKTFAGMEGAEEIIADIESRIAELFQSKIDDRKQVILQEDVEEVIAIMGAPEDYRTDSDFDEGNAGPASSEYTTRNPNRRIYRDGDDNILGGVCSGISHYFGIDPLWVRLGFVVLAIPGGTAIWAYLILWAVIPEAKTTAEKLQMKGEDVNIENIKRSVNENMENMKQKFENMAENVKQSGSRGGASLKNFLEQIFQALGTALGMIGTVIVKMIGVFFILFSVSLFVGLIGGMIATDFFFTDHGNLSWSQFSELIFLSETQMTLAYISAIILTLVPSVGLFYGGLRMLGAVKTPTRGLGLSLFGLFLIGIVLAIIVGSQIGKEFRYEHEGEKHLILNVPSDTLKIEVMNDLWFHNEVKGYNADFFELVKFEDEHIVYGKPVQLYLRKASGPDFEMEIYREAQGPSQQMAIERAERMEYAYELNDSLGVVRLGPVIKVPREDHYRGQEVEVVIRVPEGKHVSFGEHIERIYSRSGRSGKTYLMGAEELEPIR